MALFNHARPIPEVLKDETIAPRVKRLLGEIPPIKRYGEENGLKPTANYTEYVKLDRPAAVFVVSACEPLRFKPKEWTFPLVGGFPYLGWFNLDDAREFAGELKKEGWDVDVRGARAYSTLGWFRDAVLSSMIPEGPEALGDLVNVVLHESVHATAYVARQGYFNESLASFVADRLTDDYLDRSRGPGSAERAAYDKGVKDGERIEKRLHETYEKLEALYSSSRPVSEKLAEKDRILRAIKEELRFRRDITNATLFQFKAYHTGTGDFGAVLKACAGNWPRFMQAMRAVRSGAFSQPQQEDLAPVLEPIAKAGCPAT